MNKPNIKSKGGARKGAGRPFNSGKYKEPTVIIRIPKSLCEKVDGILNDFLGNIKCDDIGVNNGEHSEQIKR